MHCPKKGGMVKYLREGEWKRVEVTSRGGTAKGKNKYYFNVKAREGWTSGVHFDKVKWEEDEDYVFYTKIVLWKEDTLKYVQVNGHVIEEVNIVLIPTKEHGSPECIAAKKKEMDAFNQFDVYLEVEDTGQVRLSLRWVITDKSTPEDIEKNEKMVKARLVCRGFEETVEVQADSPTGSKKTLRMLLAIAATKGWTIKSEDIKNAYLQGEEIDRLVYMEPPAKLKRPNKL